MSLLAPVWSPRLRAGFACLLVSATAASAAPLVFEFGSGPAQIGADTFFTTARGYGLEPGAHVVPATVAGGGVLADAPFYFSAAVPAEGNYRVMVKLFNPQAAEPVRVTIKAELRRLMVENRSIPAGAFATCEFIVNTRTPEIPAGPGGLAGVVKLKAPRETTQEAWGWDHLLTLEFNGKNFVVCSVEIEPAQVPTVFLLGDSTVCDQSREPYATWGQMLPRFFKPDVAIANHGESGETYRDSIGRRRLDKIISVMKPGDWLFMQFGHNDQKQIAAKTGGPFTTYKEEIKKHIAAVRKAGGVPVIVSPMERHAFEGGKLVPSLSDYAQAAKEAAHEENVIFIDLHAMSIRLYEALGPAESLQAFAAPQGKPDTTHQNNYGGYELARCIVAAIREQKLPLAAHLWPEFDPADAALPETFAVPPSPLATNVRPLGN